MPLKLYIYFILCMLIYLVFNNLTIIFQVPRLLLWQCPGPPLCSSTIWLSAPRSRVLCHPSVVIYCLSTFQKMPQEQSIRGELYMVRVQELIWAEPLCELDFSLASCLLFVFCKPKVLTSMCNRYWCLPVSSQKTLGVHAFSFLAPSPPSPVPIPNCVKSFPFLLPFFWC